MTTRQQQRARVLDYIEHMGFHFGREALRVDAGAGLVPSEPQEGDWYQIGEKFGDLNAAEAQSFAEGYARGAHGLDCAYCEGDQHEKILEEIRSW